MQYPHARHHAEYQRYGQREDAEEQPAPQVEFEMVHVNLKSGKEHEIEQSDLSEDGKRRVVVEHIEAVGTDHHPGHYHAYDVGDFELVEEQGRKEDDGQHDKEYLHGLRHQGLRERNHFNVGGR